jgi:hypothetical protein
LRLPADCRVIDDRLIQFSRFLPVIQE